jgi:hypothetical protein
MATGSLLVKSILLYLSISIILYAGGVRLTDSNGFNSFITASNPDNGITGQNQFGLGNITSITPDTSEVSNLGGGFNFIDPIRSIRNFINLIIDVVFAIPTLFFSFPAPIQLFFGVPLAVIALLGIVYFTRSGQ